MPNKTKTIKKEAFYGCDGLQSVTIPKSTISIESEAFLHCLNVDSITIPSSVTSIDILALSEFSGLINVDPNQFIIQVLMVFYSTKIKQS